MRWALNAESTALRAEVEFFLSGSYWKIINIKLRSLSFSTEVKTWSVSCLTAFCSVTPDLARALKSCKYHELSAIMLVQPLLEKDLEEMTQVLKLQSPAPPLPPLLSSTSCSLVFFSSLPFPVPSFFNPTFSHAPPQCPFSPVFPLFHLFFFPLFLFASFSPSIPLPLFVTLASSLPGDLEWRKEASPFSLLLNTCSGNNVWKEFAGSVTMHLFYP